MVTSRSTPPPSSAKARSPSESSCAVAERVARRARRRWPAAATSGRAAGRRAARTRPPCLPTAPRPPVLLLRERTPSVGSRPEHFVALSPGPHPHPEGWESTLGVRPRLLDPADRATPDVGETLPSAPPTGLQTVLARSIHHAADLRSRAVGRRPSRRRSRRGRRPGTRRCRAPTPRRRWAAGTSRSSAARHLQRPRRQRGARRAVRAATRVTAGAASGGGQRPQPLDGRQHHHQRHAGDPRARRRRRRPRPPGSGWRRPASGPPVRRAQSAARPSSARDVDDRPVPARARRPAPAARPRRTRPRSISPVVTSGDPSGGRRLVRRARPCRSTRCGTRRSWSPRRRRVARPRQVDDGHAVGAGQVRAPARVGSPAAPTVEDRDAHVDRRRRSRRGRGTRLLEAARARRPRPARRRRRGRPATDCGCTRATVPPGAARSHAREQEQAGGVRVGAHGVAEPLAQARGVGGARGRSSAPSWLRNGGLPTTTSSRGQRQVVEQRVGHGEVPGRWRRTRPQRRARPRWSRRPADRCRRPTAASTIARRASPRGRRGGARRPAGARRRRTPGRRPSGDSSDRRAPARRARRPARAGV